MDWDKLKVFYNVATWQNFTKAAKVMNLNQSSVTRQVQDLEHRLKVKLLIRTSHAVTLTEEGVMLFDIVKNILADIEKFKFSVQEYVHEPIGDLRIATTNAMAYAWLPSYIPDFLSQYPNVSLTIIGSDQELDLYAREADVVIGTYAEIGNEFIQDHLMTFHMGLFASPSYLETFGTPQTVDDLDHHRLLVFGDYYVHPYGNINWSLRLGKGRGVRKPYLCLNSSQGLYMLTSSGIGIAPLSQEYVGFYEKKEGKRLVRILPEVDGPEIKIYFTYPRALAKVRRVILFREFLKEVVQKHYNQSY